LSHWASIRSVTPELRSIALTYPKAKYGMCGHPDTVLSTTRKVKTTRIDSTI